MPVDGTGRQILLNDESLRDGLQSLPCAIPHRGENRKSFT